MKKSILFLLGSFAAVSSLLFHTQEAKAGKLLDTCRVGSVVILKKNNAGNYVVKYKWGSVLFSDNDEEDARAFFNSEPVLRQCCSATSHFFSKKS